MAFIEAYFLWMTVDAFNYLVDLRFPSTVMVVGHRRSMTATETLITIGRIIALRSGEFLFVPSRPLEQFVEQGE